MKHQNSDLQSTKHRHSSNDTEERILTREEGAALLREAEEAGNRYLEYMRMREAQKKAEEKICEQK